MVITSKDYEMAELGKCCTNALTNRNDCTVVEEQQLSVSHTDPIPEQAEVENCFQRHHRES